MLIKIYIFKLFILIHRLLDIACGVQRDLSPFLAHRKGPHHAREKPRVKFVLSNRWRENSNEDKISKDLNVSKHTTSFFFLTLSTFNCFGFFQAVYQIFSIAKNMEGGVGFFLQGQFNISGSLRT